MHTLRDLVKKIQFDKGLTIAEIAKAIGYSRTYFTLEIDKDDNPKMREKLYYEYGDILSGMRDSENGKSPQHKKDDVDLKDKIISLLEEKMDSNLVMIKENQMHVMAVLQTVRSALIDLLAKFEKQDAIAIADRLNKETASHLENMKKTGN